MHATKHNPLLMQATKRKADRVSLKDSVPPIRDPRHVVPTRPAASESVRTPATTKISPSATPKAPQPVTLFSHLRPREFKVNPDGTISDLSKPAGSVSSPSSLPPQPQPAVSVPPPTPPPTKSVKFFLDATEQADNAFCFQPYADVHDAYDLQPLSKKNYSHEGIRSFTPDVRIHGDGVPQGTHQGHKPPFFDLWHDNPDYMMELEQEAESVPFGVLVPPPLTLKSLCLAPFMQDVPYW
jgi:hypothetical protein